MSEIARIVEQLKQVHEGEAWHGPSVQEALSGVSAADAVRRPIAGGHCIWEVAHHIRAVDEAVRAHVAGQDPPDLPDWPTLSDTSEAAWRRLLDALAAVERGLRDALCAFPESRLHENVPGGSRSYWYELLGAMHHDLYHAGQIALLRKGL